MDEKLPRYAMFRKSRVRILNYCEGTQTFVVLTSKDEQYWVKRSQLTFLPDKKK